MKKYLIYLIFMLIMPMAVSAQSSMTDTQVMQYVMKAKEQGKSQSQIVTDLMQRGVDISQIRRVRNKYERQLKQGGLGNVSDDPSAKTDTRLRTNNGKTRDQYTRSDYGREVYGLSEGDVRDGARYCADAGAASCRA